MWPVTKKSNWGRRRTATLGRCLILVSAFVFIAVEGKKAASPLSAKAASAAKSKTVCLSAKCKRTASAILSKMKTEIDPCDNFYEFACGKYIDETQLGEHEDYMNPILELEHKYKEQLRDVIAEERSASDPQYLKMPNQLYKACMNTTLIDALGGQPIQQISDSLGGWPIVVGSSWNSDNSWDLRKTFKKFRRLGLSIGSLFDITISTHNLNSTRRVIYIDQLTYSIEYDDLKDGINNTEVLAYYDYMVDIAVLFGADRETAKNELRESLQFELELIGISDRFLGYSKMETVKQFQRLQTYINWVDFINDFLPEGVKIDGSEEILRDLVLYHRQMCRLLERTNKRVIANYIMWRVHADSLPYLSDEFRRRKLEFDTDSSNIQSLPPRWKECTDIVSDRLPFAVASLYMAKHFNKNTKAKVQEMIDNMRSRFSVQFDNARWMDEDSKQALKEKLNAMTTHIGYPDGALDNEHLAESYRKLEINPDKYFESILNISIFNTDYKLNMLRVPVKKTDWVTYNNIVTLGAYMSSRENSIYIPAGYLQEPFFNSQLHKYMNYGAVGPTIGHVVTRIFHELSRQLLKNDALDVYRKKQLCIQRQYDKFTDDQTGLDLGGSLTTNANVADNAGTRLAYLAYTKWLTKNGKELSLPGLSYTPRQMFWISAAQARCTKYETTYLEERLSKGGFVTQEYRILGPLKNMDAFSSDFRCANRSAMNPKRKCKLW